MLSSPSNKTSLLFYSETGCNRDVSEEHGHRGVKSSTGFEREEIQVASFLP